MHIKDLIKIGRLGSYADKDGLFRLISEDGFQPDYWDLKDIFLVFPDNRVYYVTVNNWKRKNGKLFLDFVEKEIPGFVDDSKRTDVMVDPQTYHLLTGEETEKLYYGAEVVFNDVVIGVVDDSFNNSQYEIFQVILKDDEKEVMIPDVDQFIVSKSDSVVVVQNVEDLLEL